MPGSILEDGSRVMPLMLNGYLMKEPKPLETTTGRLMLWKSIPTEDIHISELLLLKTQDGGKCSDMKVDTSPMSTERLSMFKERLTQKEDISNVTRTRINKSINNGTLSTLMSGRVNQEKESSMKNMVCTSKDHSISFLD